MIQLADPAREHHEHQEAIESAALRVLRGGVYILGPEVSAFEAEFSAYCGARHAVGVSNGSDAIVVALHALGIGPGDEVITTAFSYFATASAVLRVGAKPVFADIDLETFNLDPAEVERRVTPRTRAIIAVHLFGRCAEVDRLAELARERGIALIEDAAQACGAARAGRRVGTLGAIACFSFFPAKPLGCDGDGGACVTDDPALYQAMLRARVTGASAKNVHTDPGGNYRLDPLQAAILRAKLPRYEARIARRRSNASALREALDGLPDIVLPSDDPRGRHVYAQFTLRHPRREALQSALRDKGIAAEVYYPVPMPLQGAVATLGHSAGDFPATERAAAEVLSIPVHSELTGDELRAVIDGVRAAAREVGA